MSTLSENEALEGYKQATALLERVEPLEQSDVEHLYQMLWNPSMKRFSEKESDPDHPASIVKSLFDVFSFVKDSSEEAFTSTRELHLKKSDPFGKSGSYYVKGKENNILFVFKPELEEKNQGMVGYPIGSGAKREQVAYLLAKRQNVPVPATLYVKLGDRVGSLQRFVLSQTNLSHIHYDTPEQIPNINKRDLQSIALFDARIKNGDRHSNNILATEDRQGGFSLVAIDHATTLSDVRDDMLVVDYYGLPQINAPIDEQIIQEILGLNLLSDAALMKQHGFSSEPILWITKSTLFLQMALKKNQTIQQQGLKPLTVRDLLSYLKTAHQSIPTATAEEFGYLLNILLDRKQKS